ncbi:zinc ribbon domain-containing protein [Streptomyces bauhiniae]|uniref:Zinc ribbon domain-containing protein n=1 Tax=Streptomyces bauhiniae TaxID=2340725 RepID=A0A4Z1CVC7_9ACTN|nr:zinc ribbon domain-containing protein [Streptomyces bauhiniae]TGN72826.1 zinc ribbon domain-containing protein [Streptomyces bauhiniae]
MRECPACGASNEATDDFCGNCGSYLGWSEGSERSSRTWSGAAAAVPVEPEAAPEPAPEPVAEPAPARTDEAEPPTPTPAPAPEPTPAPPRPVAPEPPAAPQPVKPAKAVAPRPVVRPLPADEDTSGIPCPVCRTPNPPHRRFCRKCAAPLAPVAAPEPLPWWRTVWPFRRRTRAGSGALTRLLVILAVVLALCVAGFLLLPAGRALIEDTRDKLGTPKAVSPSRVTATAELPGHSARLTTDGLTNRYWAIPGKGASVTYAFAKPFRFVDVIVTNGASKNAEDYGSQARALHLDMDVYSEDGEVRRKEIDLSDKPGPQPVAVGMSRVTSVRLTLSDPVGLSGGRHIALAEVEFFQRT